MSVGMLDFQTENNELTISDHFSFCKNIKNENFLKVLILGPN